MNVIERPRETEYVPQDWPYIQNTVNVEVGIEAECLVIDIIPQLAWLCDVCIVWDPFICLMWKR